MTAPQSGAEKYATACIDAATAAANGYDSRAASCMVQGDTVLAEHWTALANTHRTYARELRTLADMAALDKRALLSVARTLDLAARRNEREADEFKDSGETYAEALHRGMATAYGVGSEAIQGAGA